MEAWANSSAWTCAASDAPTISWSICRQLYSLGGAGGGASAAGSRPAQAASATSRTISRTRSIHIAALRNGHPATSEEVAATYLIRLITAQLPTGPVRPVPSQRKIQKLDLRLSSIGPAKTATPRRGRCRECRAGPGRQRRKSGQVEPEGVRSQAEGTPSGRRQGRPVMRAGKGGRSALPLPRRHSQKRPCRASGIRSRYCLPLMCTSSVWSPASK
ncbi:hypothetical protein D9M71_111350 [compost metagenome]